MKKISIGIRNVVSGDGVVVVEPANIYECMLGDNVFIGPFTEIQRGCKIGDSSRIQSHTFICEHVTIGKRCFIAHSVTFANDLFKSGGPNPDPESWVKITLGDDVTIGSGATILAKEICSGTIIGAGSVVTKSIYKKGIYAGNPAKLLRKL